ncbi:MAG TPA: EscU/YscU/HrcU family type III secretion system export apparatus switch protein [Kofleriaceae bacterium]|nr:EscU/YscU/HrcU family type III secretion system export apparatus switch protein [Kofleriaceae bacterium]
MAEHRAFPPSPHRRALARRAGLHAASSVIVGSAAGATTLVAVGAIGGALMRRLGSAIAAACSGQAVLAPAALPETVAAAALPILGAAAIAALIAHLAQTRAAWLPRRRIAGAPAVEVDAWARARRAAGRLAAGAVIGGVALAWLWQAAPHIAGLVAFDPVALPITSPATRSPLFVATTTLIANLALALVLAWLALGVLDAVVRHAALARALAMTPAEKRQDDRLAGADPRWRARRAAIQRGLGPNDAVAGASVLLVGDDTAVAIAWDPVRRPIPIRTATGRGPRASQLLGLARRYRIAVHRDPVLAATLVRG